MPNNQRSTPMPLPPSTQDLATEPESATKPLSAAAKRALAEAELRRRARLAAEQQTAAEQGGRKGPDPIRYGDWEKDGIASDF